MRRRLGRLLPRRGGLLGPRDVLQRHDRRIQRPAAGDKAGGGGGGAAQADSPSYPRGDAATAATGSGGSLALASPKQRARPGRCCAPARLAEWHAARRRPPHAGYHHAYARVATREQSHSDGLGGGGVEQRVHGNDPATTSTRNGDTGGSSSANGDGYDADNRYRAVDAGGGQQQTRMNERESEEEEEEEEAEK